jgi:hypothetical protein
MKIDKIEVSLGRTINLGNYESARIDVRMSASLGDADDADECYQILYNEVDSRVAAEVDVLTPQGVNVPKGGQY